MRRRVFVTFYQNFSALCEQRNIKPSRVAEACGINRSNVSNWKKNGYTPRAEDLKKIAEYLRVSVGYLLQTEAECEYSSGAGWYPPEFFWEKINSDRKRFLHYFLQGNSSRIDELENIWHISVEHPENVSDETFKRFVEGTVRLLCLYPEEGEWGFKFKGEEMTVIENPDIRMIARAGRKMTPEQAENVRKYAQYMYPEAFEE